MPAGPWRCGWKTSATVPRFGPCTVVAGTNHPVATLGLSIGENGTVYRQTHRIDNGGEVERMRLSDGKVEADRFRGQRRPPTCPAR